MDKTKYKYLEKSYQAKGFPQPPLFIQASKVGDIIELPDPKKTDTNFVDIKEAINQRVSIRTYSKKPLTISELSYILWSTQGVKSITGKTATLRTVPSAGARHSFETYLLINNVENLLPGLYHYLAIEHKLQMINMEKDIAKKITLACLNQRFIINSAITMILTAVRYRMTWRYSERGYRYIHLDAGHVIQNLYLCAEAIDSGVCAIAAFDDDLLNKTIGVDGVEQFTVYLGVLGKKP
jgi:SagB-type dehydrogenase family enzyme